MLHVELGERPGRLAAIHDAAVSTAAYRHALEEAVVTVPRLALGDGVDQAPDRPAASRRPENRQSKLGAMKSVVVADPETPPAAESVRKEADKLAAAVEAAAEEVKPVAEAAPKKKRGFSPFKGFGKKKEA